MTNDPLDAIRDLIQVDIGNRGLRNDPSRNLITECADDFRAACLSIAQHPKPAVAIVTGFYIPHANPPAAETDGPLGALFLARALHNMGIRVCLLTDPPCLRALAIGLKACKLHEAVALLPLPERAEHWPQFLEAGWLKFVRDRFPLSHIVFIERVGPNHTLRSLQEQSQAESLGESYLDFLSEVGEGQQDRCYSANGRDITDYTAPAQLLIESLKQANLSDVSIGIGDGGNEIGMGRISWQVIRRNIPRGGLIACRVPTDLLIVCGISNWGAYGLSRGLEILRGKEANSNFYSPDVELRLLKSIVEYGPLVDGVLGRQSATVDGIDWTDYSMILKKLAKIQ